MVSLGQQVQVKGTPGVVRFVGATRFAPGEWVGVELREAVGRNDGSVDGERYFAAAAGCGVFVRAAAVDAAAADAGAAAADGATAAESRLERIVATLQAKLRAATQQIAQLSARLAEQTLAVSRLEAEAEMQAVDRDFHSDAAATLGRQLDELAAKYDHVCDELAVLQEEHELNRQIEAEVARGSDPQALAARNRQLEGAVLQLEGVVARNELLFAARVKDAAEEAQRAVAALQLDLARSRELAEQNALLTARVAELERAVDELNELHEVDRSIEENQAAVEAELRRQVEALQRECARDRGVIEALRHAAAGEAPPLPPATADASLGLKEAELACLREHVGPDTLLKLSAARVSYILEHAEAGAYRQCQLRCLVVALGAVEASEALGPHVRALLDGVEAVVDQFVHGSVAHARVDFVAPFVAAVLALDAPAAAPVTLALTAIQVSTARRLGDALELAASLDAIESLTAHPVVNLAALFGKLDALLQQLVALRRGEELGERDAEETQRAVEVAREAAAAAAAAALPRALPRAAPAPPSPLEGLEEALAARDRRICELQTSVDLARNALSLAQTAHDKIVADLTASLASVRQQCAHTRQEYAALVAEHAALALAAPANVYTEMEYSDAVLLAAEVHHLRRMVCYYSEDRADYGWLRQALRRHTPPPASGATLVSVGCGLRALAQAPSNTRYRALVLRERFERYANLRGHLVARSMRRAG